MTSDELIYFILLLISVPLGHFIKTRNSFKQKQYLSTGIGVAIVVVLCRGQCLHSLITTTVNCLIIALLSPRVCHLVSFVWCFGYIVFFRSTHLFGLPPVLPFANAIQLLLTLKLVGVAFEVHETYINEQKLASNQDEEQLQLKNEYKNVRPSFLDLFLYSYCYIGILTGPYYKYRTYYDMLHEKNGSNIETLAPMLKRLAWAPVYGAGFLLASRYFSLEYMNGDAFPDDPFWFRFFYMVPMFFIFRMRFYVAWVLAECMCMTAGLGAYPTASKPRVGSGPSDLAELAKCKRHAPEGIAYDFETIHNIDEYGVDLAPTMREGVRSWNMTVQYWMVKHVYSVVPVRAGLVKAVATWTVSAFWHGFHPGYYMCFFSFIPPMIAEDMLVAKLRSGKPPARQKVFNWLCWFHKQRQFDYVNMGFQLLSMERTMRYWRSIYFSMHIMQIVLIALGLVLMQVMPGSRAKRSCEGDAASKKQQ